MSRIHFIPLPAALVQKHEFDLKAGFAFLHARAFPVERDNTLLVLSHLFYNYSRYNPNDKRLFQTLVATRYDDALNLVEQREMGEVQQGVESQKSYDGVLDFAVLPHSGETIVTTKAGQTFVCDADLQTVTREWNTYNWADRETMYRENFACRIAPCDDGRLLCLIPEARFEFLGNVLALSREPIESLANAPAPPQPVLDYVTSLVPRYGGVDAPIPYVRFGSDDAPFHPRSRPSPTLVDVLGGQHQKWVLPPPSPGSSLGPPPFFYPVAMQLLPLNGDRFLVCLAEGKRSNKNSPFAYVIVDKAGKVQNALLLHEQDTPHVHAFYAVARDPIRQKLYWKTAKAFYKFDENGTRTLHLPLDTSPALKLFRAFRILGSAPPGGPVALTLYHPREHLLLVLSAPQKQEEWAAVIEKGVSDYKKKRAELKKAHNPINYRWLRGNAP